MYFILDLPLVTHFFDLPLVWRVFQIGHGHEAIVVFAAVVVFEELDGENVMQSRVLIGQRDTVSLAADTLEYAEGSNPARG